MNRDDLDPLLHRCLAAGRYFLETYDDFAPFALTLGADGETRFVRGDTGEERLPPAVFLARLIGALREGARGHRATGLVSNVQGKDDRKGGRTAAIRVALEHAEGTSIHYYLPYRREAGGTRYDEAFAEEAGPEVFGDSLARP